MYPKTVFIPRRWPPQPFSPRQEGRKVYVVGEGALTHELYMAGFSITDVDPDFVVVGETRNPTTGT